MGSYCVTNASYPTPFSHCSWFLQQHFGKKDFRVLRFCLQLRWLHLATATWIDFMKHYHSCVFYCVIFTLNILHIVQSNSTELLILTFFSFKVVCLKGVSWAENFVTLRQKLRVVSGCRFFSKAMLSFLKISDLYLLLGAAFIAWKRTR